MPHRRVPKRRPIAEINVVPYIDVMLVLLVIFMITAPLLTEGVKIDLPQAEQAESVDQATEQPLIIDVDRDGQFYIRTGDEPTPLDAETLVAEHIVNRRSGDRPRHRTIGGQRPALTRCRAGNVEQFVRVETHFFIATVP